jgi:hypothetical protein
VPNIGKLLWPRSVAVVGASSNTHGLRGRIFEIMRSHPFAGQLYPVSRSAAEVQGVKAYPSVDALPQAVDLAMLIVPAELCRWLSRARRHQGCDHPSSGFAEEKGDWPGAAARSRRSPKSTTWRWMGRTAGLCQHRRRLSYVQSRDGRRRACWRARIAPAARWVPQSGAGLRSSITAAEDLVPPPSPPVTKPA